ncbi:hypothetical protein I4U23_022917 [Adineta vaga]|nr:hypothetical protein I4U23_022917 [Adineta vaga]
MSIDKTMMMLNSDSEEEEGDNIKDNDTTNEQQDGRASILICLDNIDSKFINSNPVHNLKIDFTQGYASSVNAQQQP